MTIHIRIKCDCSKTDRRCHLIMLPANRTNNLMWNAIQMVKLNIQSSKWKFSRDINRAELVGLNADQNLKIQFKAPGCLRPILRFSGHSVGFDSIWISSRCPIETSDIQLSPRIGCFSFGFLNFLFSNFSPRRPVQFSSVHHLTLHFPSNFGEDNTRIYYIGLRGEFSPAHYHGVTICNYESRPNVSDHKNNAFDSVNHSVQ